MESKDKNEDLTSRPGSFRSMPPVPRKSLFILCLLAFLIASLWALQTWANQWAWLQTIQALHQAGESIDLKDFIPPPIPDEENFAAQPREGEALLRDSKVLPTFRHAVQSQRAWDF